MSRLFYLIAALAAATTPCYAQFSSQSYYQQQDIEREQQRIDQRLRDVEQRQLLDMDQRTNDILLEQMYRREQHDDLVREIERREEKREFDRLLNR